MRKLISILVLFGMLFVAGPALACDNDFTNADAHVAVGSYDQASGWGPWGADTWAYGTSGANGDAYTQGTKFSYATADADTESNAYAFDMGFVAVAGACTTSEADAFGFSLGRGHTATQAGAYGEVGHQTVVNGAYGTGAMTQGGASYNSLDQDFSCGWCGSIDYSSAGGYATTSGMSFVAPNGTYASATATSQSAAY